MTAITLLSVSACTHVLVRPYHTTHNHSTHAPACHHLPLNSDTLANRDLKKKMSPTNARALNTMRQRLKKHNTSEELAALIAKFR
jgi:Eukaryotic translation initiation factor 3 subunit 8 N-terminus